MVPSVSNDGKFDSESPCKQGKIVVEPLCKFFSQQRFPICMHKKQLLQKQTAFEKVQKQKFFPQGGGGTFRTTVFPCFFGGEWVGL